jgi:drug/metabolite transporter (DMT)-like permease
MRPDATKWATSVGPFGRERSLTAPVASRVEAHRAAFAFACLALGAIVIGASPIFVRLADVGPYASAFWRTFLALPILWAWARIEHRGETVIAFDRPVLLAGLFFAGDLFFWHLAILGTTVANATFLATTAPIWVAFGAWLLTNERVGVRTVLGLALCLSGGAALLGQSYGFAPERLWGDVFGLTTAVFFGAYVLAVRRARERHGAGRMIFLSTIVTTACLFVIALLLEPVLLPQSARGLAVLIVLAVVCQAGGQGLVAIALGTLPATFSALVIFLEAIAAAAFGWAILGEALGPVQVLGGVLILVGIWVARPRSGTAIGEAGP